MTSLWEWYHNDNSWFMEIWWLVTCGHGLQHSSTPLCTTILSRLLVHKLCCFGDGNTVKRVPCSHGQGTLIPLWGHRTHKILVQCQTFGYVPSQKALPLPLGRYSFPILLRVGGWVCMSGWLYAMIVYLWMVTHLSCNWAQCSAE